jgi:tetratricopeptide (TPR) repeat protein
VATAVVVIASAVATRQYVWVWRDGVTLWTHAVAVDPTSHRAHANLGDALMLARQYPAALREFREAVRLAPQVSEYHRQVGEAFVRNGQIADALAVFEAELARLPPRAASGAASAANVDRIWALNQRGIALAKLGRHPEAIASLAEAVQLDPSSAVSHSNLCVVLGGTGRYDEGQRECQEAIRLDPRLADAHSNLGAIALGKGDASGAVNGFTAALRLDALSAGRHLKLGAALARLGRMEEARQAFTEAIRLDPGDAEAHNALGAVLAELKRDREAIVEFTEAVRLQPGLTHAYANRGLSLATLGDFKSAILDYQQVLRIDPNNAGARSAVDALQRKLSGR